MTDDDHLYEDKTLFAKIAEGDAEAFKKLFHRYSELLVPFIVKLIQSREGQHEIIQEIFLKIWLHRHKLPGVDNPKGWIIRIAANEATNYLQQLARQNRLMFKAKGKADAQPINPEQVLAAKDTALLIAEAVSRLPPGVQRVYLLSREEQLTIPEIAAKLNISENTVKNQLVTALKRIKKHLQDRGNNNFFAFLLFF